MAEKPWGAFYSEIRPHAPHCPEPTMDRALRNITAEFFRDTSVHKVKLAEQNLTIATPEYTLAPPANTVLERVVEGYVMDEDGGDRESLRQIWPTTINDLLELRPNWREEDGNVTNYLHDLNNLTVRVYPIPIATVTNGLVLWATVSPHLDDSTGIPEEHYNRHKTAIVKGVLARLLSQPNKAWTDYKQAGIYQAQFNRGKTKAIIEFFTNYGAIRLQTRPRWPLA